MRRRLLLSDIEGIRDRLYKKRYVTHDDHWIWLGAENLQGYGLMTVEGKQLLVTRLSLYISGIEFDIFNNNIWALHKNSCHKRLCFNPAHLYSGNRGNNMSDYSIYKQTELFPCGHPKDPKYTVVTMSNGYIRYRCRECYALYMKSWHEKNKS